VRVGARSVVAVEAVDQRSKVVRCWNRTNLTRKNKNGGVSLLGGAGSFNKSCTSCVLPSAPWLPDCGRCRCGALEALTYHAARLLVGDDAVQGRSWRVYIFAFLNSVATTTSAQRGTALPPRDHLHARCHRRPAPTRRTTPSWPRAVRSLERQPASLLLHLHRWAPTLKSSTQSIRRQEDHHHLSLPVMMMPRAIAPQQEAKRKQALLSIPSDDLESESESDDDTRSSAKGTSSANARCVFAMGFFDWLRIAAEIKCLSLVCWSHCLRPHARSSSARSSALYSLGLLARSPAVSLRGMGRPYQDLREGQPDEPR
jgi:hypothetical protein